MPTRTLTIKDHRSRTDCARQIMHLSIQGDPLYMVEITKSGPRRTLPQNRLLWGYIYRPIAKRVSDQMGTVIEAKDIHEACKQMFLPTREVRIGKLTITRPLSTKELKRSRSDDDDPNEVVTFGEYLEQIFQWAAEEFGLVLTLPNEPPWPEDSK